MRGNKPHHTNTVLRMRTVKGTFVCISDTEKDLGITFGTELVNVGHVNYSIKKGSIVTWLITRSFLFITSNSFVKL